MEYRALEKIGLQRTKEAKYPRLRYGPARQNDYKNSGIDANELTGDLVRETGWRSERD